MRNFKLLLRLWDTRWVVVHLSQLSPLQDKHLVWSQAALSATPSVSPELSDCETSLTWLALTQQLEHCQVG